MNKITWASGVVSWIVLCLVATACTPQQAQTAHLTAQADAANTFPAVTLSSNSPTIQLTDGLGQAFNFPAPVQHIVSLAPSNTEILFAIGAGSQVIGRDSYSDYPNEALQVKNIGGGFNQLDSETILSLHPDLVLVSSLTPPEQIQALQKLGLTVFALANPSDINGMYINLLTVASLTGHSGQAQTLIQNLKTRVGNVEQKLTNLTSRPLVFYELDGTDPNAPWTAGPGTFIDTLIDMAGGANLGQALKSDWAQISVEELIAKDPAIILIGDAYWGGVTVQAVKARTGWDALSAVKNGQVFPFDDNLVSRPGPRLIDGLEALAAFLHPELFQ
jgi:iron complex transport system substrate-binding protein